MQRIFSNKFKAMNYVNDMCLGAKINDKDFRIKVPISCIVSYMGFTALVIAQTPCAMDDNSLL